MKKNFSCMLALIFFCISQQICLFESFEQSVLPQSDQYQVDLDCLSVDQSSNLDRGFAFWSFNIPLIRNIYTSYEINEPFQINSKDDGQILVSIKSIENDDFLAIIFKKYDYSSLEVHHVFQIYNQGNLENTLIFKFPALNYEGRWQLHLITFTFDLINNSGFINIEVSDNQKQSITLLFYQSYKIILGGRGYIQNYNLNIFQGRLSKIINLIDHIYNSESFQQIYDTCLIPQESDQIVINIVSGLKIYDGNLQQFKYFQHSGLNYYISGWLKFYIQNRALSHYTLIRLSGYQKYENKKKIGDELFLYEIELNSKDPQNSKIIISTDAYCMPEVQSFQEQYNKVFQDTINQQYQVYQTQKIIYDNSNNYIYEGLTQWHFLQFEYLGVQNNDKMTIKLTFFNDLNVIEYKLGNDIFQGQFVNSQFYFLFGGDSLNDNFFIGEAFDLQIIYQYQNSLLQTNIQSCHSLCKTCNGPFINNCLSCFEENNRYYVSGLNICLCQDDYIELSDQSCQKKDYLFPFLTMEYIENIQSEECPFGYFYIPKDNGKYDCKQCPQFHDDYSFFCADCFLRAKTWYIKPICKLDLLRTTNDLSATFFEIIRKEDSQDVYLIADNQELTLFSDFKDFKIEIGNLSKKYKHLGQNVLPICKFNAQVNEDTLDCPNRDPFCIYQKSNLGGCLECIQGYYPSWNSHCKKCSNNCQTCEIDWFVESTICQSCYENYGLIDGSCQPCGINCIICKSQQKNENENYLKCMKCLDDSNYYFSLNGIDCKQKTIPNCLYSFEALDNDFKINSLDNNFIIQDDQINIVEYCARCIEAYHFIFEEFNCVQIKNINCDFGIGYLDSTDNIYKLSECLISSDQQSLIQTIQFAKDCKLHIQNCISCLQTDLENKFICLECKFGYYASKLTGLCISCPININCDICYEEESISQNHWKTQTRAFYRRYIELNDGHLYTNYGQSQNSEDYKISCLQCKDGYKQYQNNCIPYCFDDCEECIFYDQKYQCLKCQKIHNYHSLSLDNNKCIECPFNCQYCRPKIQEEINSINPLFNNEKFKHYSHTCLIPIKNEQINYQYDQQLGLFFQCDEQNKNLCNNKIVIEMYLYFQDWQYWQDYDNIQNEYEQKQFRQQNTYFDELLEHNSFPQYQTDGFYTLANKLSIQTIVIRMKCKCNNQFYGINTGIISQRFSENIFSLRNIELELIFSQDSFIILSHRISIINFTKIFISKLSIQYLSYLPNFYSVLLKSKYKQEIHIEQFTYKGSKSIKRSNYTGVVFQIENFQSFKINQLIMNQCYNYKNSLFTFQSNIENIKIQITNVKFTDSTFINITLFQFLLNSNSFVTISHLEFQGNFTNSKFLQSESSINDLNLNNLQIYNSQINDSSSFFYFTNLKYSQINSFNIEQTLINNSTIINIENNINLNQIAVKQCQLIGDAKLLFNDNENVPNFDVTITDLIFSDNTYSNIIKFITFKSNFNQNESLIINNLIISNNYLTNTSLIYNNNQEQSSLIYIQISNVRIYKFIIERGPGLIDIFFKSIVNLVLNNGLITQTKYSFKGLHPNLKCQLQKVSGKFYPSSIFIFSSYKVFTDYLQILNVKVYDFPIFQFISTTSISDKNNVTLSINQLIIKNNLLLLTETINQLALINIICSQYAEITISNSVFNQNIYHEYLQNLYENSACLLAITGNLISVNLIYSHFEANLALNSTNSLILIHSNQIVINNCVFYKNSLFLYEVIKQNLIWGFDNNQVYIEDLIEIFPIKQKAGIGNFKAQNIQIFNNIINQTEGIQGGCFQIETINSATMVLNNNSFYSIKTLFQNDIENGGVIYLSSQSLLPFKLIVQNLFVQNIYCKKHGGIFYIDVTSPNVNIIITNFSSSNIYSQVGSIIYSVFQPLNTGKIQIEITNFTLNNSLDGYLKYLNYFNNKSSISEMFALINNRTLFYFQNLQSLKISNVQINNLQFESFLLFENSTNLIMANMHIFNSTLVNNLISVTIPQNINSTIYTSNSKFTYLTINNLQFNYKCNEVIKSTSPQQYVCLKKDKTAPSNLYSNRITDNSNYAYCLINEMIQYININQAELIQFENLNKFTKVQFIDVMFNFINCQICNRGLLFLKYNTQDILQMQKILQLQVLDSQCGQSSCLIINKTNEIQNRLLNVKYDNNQSYELIISKYECFRNNATYGTCLMLDSIITIIQVSDFKYNIAKEIGGAIYIAGNQKLIIENSEIEKNQANIGGGVYLKNQSPIIFQNLANQVNDNIAIYYGENHVSNPTQLTLQISSQIFNTSIILHNSKQILEIINVTKYQFLDGSQTTFIYMPSGQSIKTYQFFDYKYKVFLDSNLTLRILALGRDQDIIKNLDNTFCSIQSRKLILNQNDEIFTNNYTSITQIQFDTITQTYNLDDLIIYFDSNLPVDQFLQLEFACNSIQIPIYSTKYPYEILSTHSNYKLRANFKTYKCQYGEIVNQTNFACEQCNSTLGMFSLELNKSKCDIINEISTIEVLKNVLHLRPGFWRPFFDTKDISDCFNLPNNCLGGWIEGDTSCYLGHIGALCEQCDLYDTRGKGRYSQSERFSCKTCIDQRKNTIYISATILLTIIFLFISVQGNLKNLEINNRFKPIFRQTLSTNVTKTQSSILMKMLTNYLQIIVTITTFQLKFPIGLQNTMNAIGNPIQTATYSLDCFLADMFSYQIQYGRMIWQLIMPFIYVNIFFILYWMTTQFKLTSFNSSVITTTFIYMFIYFQPNLIGGLVQLLSYRQISGFKWIQANVAYRYDTSLHYQWTLKFSLPIIIILSILIPAYLFYGLFKNRDKLQIRSTRQNWGYLYNEYKLEAYYWELIKIFEKALIILSLNYYEDNIVVKGILVLIITYLYQELNSSYKPYNLFGLNRLDYYSANICMITIGLAIGAYVTQITNITELKIPFFILMGLINFYFLQFILGRILEEYAKSYEGVLDLIRDKLRNFLPSNINFLHKILKNRANQRKIVKDRFLRAKRTILPLVKSILQTRKCEISLHQSNQFNRQTTQKEILSIKIQILKQV